MRKSVIVAIVAVALLVAIVLLRSRASINAKGGSAGSTDVATASSVHASSSSDAGAYPRAMKDQGKRDEMRRRLLAAAAEAASAATQNAALPRASAEHESGDGTNSARGQRETSDIAEFGRFVAQAIREDFIPMARACAKELASRKPEARGKALVAFEILGDPKIGGVVNDAQIDRAESTLQDTQFETCVRESMYGVYFDPPPAGGMATLRFPVSITDEDGGIDEEVEDFHLKDRR